VAALVVATSNPDKVREIRELLAGAPVEIKTLSAWPGLDAPEETAARSKRMRAPKRSTTRRSRAN